MNEIVCFSIDFTIRRIAFVELYSVERGNNNCICIHWLLLAIDMICDSSNNKTTGCAGDGTFEAPFNDLLPIKRLGEGIMLLLYVDVSGCCAYSDNGRAPYCILLLFIHLYGLK